MMQRKYETVVGFFVVASLAALLVMVLIIAKQERLWEAHVEYHAIFKNVSGLKAGSEARLAGVTVGNVKGVTVNPQGNIVVAFEVVGRYREQIRQDTRASIGFIGLLGEKSLDLTAGSPDKPAIPPEGLVTSIEPLDVTELFARFQPSLENLQKMINNLATLSQSLVDSESDFAKSMAEVHQIINKINQGKGTLGLFISDPAFYKEATQAIAAANKVLTDLDQGVFGALAKTPGAKEKAQQTLADFQSTMSNASKAATRLPDIVKKLDGFLSNLEKAGKGLPELVTQAETTASDFDRTTKAMQKSWLLRRHVPQPQERTILMDSEPAKD